MVSAPRTLAAIFCLCVLSYAGAFLVSVSVDADSAWSRFDALASSGKYGRAVGHGDKAIALLQAADEDGERLQAMQYETAIAHDEATGRGGDAARAIDLYRIVLDSPLGSRMTDEQRNEIRNRIAQLSFTVDRPVDAAVLMADFVDVAGDAAAEVSMTPSDPALARLLGYAKDSLLSFENSLKPVADFEVIQGTEQERLDAAERLTRLGGYYARFSDGQYAAAGLLAAAYRTRLEILGPDDLDTVQTGLLLAPVYEEIGRVEDAVDVYLQAFHAQERVRGPNNPELSLYIRLLSDIYRRQGRVTEAEALNVHMRTIFRDAFGARRYAANRERDRRADINRPVSPEFPLPPEYAPDDLIAAAVFSIPVSKDPSIDEMKIRAAYIDAETTMPKMLADLIGECRSDAEQLSLRSGYRSYATQNILYTQTNHGGKVAAPGTSEHQTGLAADIDVNGRLMRSTDRAYQCFEAQAWRYGFILTYPRGNTYLDAEDGYEPWHWRFVGPRTATLYREFGPMGYPQEFLAAFPCYEERALAGLFMNAGEQDVCLEQVLGTLASADAAPAAGGTPPIGLIAGQDDEG